MTNTLFWDFFFLFNFKKICSLKVCIISWLSACLNTHKKSSHGSHSHIWDHRIFWPVKHSCNLWNMQLFYPLLKIRKIPTRSNQSTINGIKTQNKYPLTHKSTLNWVWTVLIPSFCNCQVTVIWFSSNNQEIDTL